MNLESLGSFESKIEIKLEIEKGFETFVPEDFKQDPFGYFESKGKNIKSGEAEYNDDGLIVEDPTATKDLPVWTDEKGVELHTVGKKVNTVKSQVGKSEDPFYEYKVMEIAREFGLPAPIPVAKVEAGDNYLLVMQKVSGLRWTDEGMKPIHNAGLSDDEKQDLLLQAQGLIDGIKEQYEKIGLYRNWKMKDMVFNVDIQNRKVLSVIPTDWERTKIDYDRLEEARKN